MATTEMTRPGGASTSTTQDVGDELSHDAGRLRDTAKERALQEADTRKEQATQAAKSTSSALDKAAQELKQDQNAPDWLASAFETTASKIKTLASDIEDRSPEQLGRDASRFARQNPTTFLAASAAVGFAAARFLRAGSEYQHHRQGGESYGATGYAGGSTGYGSTSPAGGGSDFSGAGQSRYTSAEGGTVL